MVIKTCILLLMGIFYAAYFLKLLIQKNQGIKTDNLGKGNKDNKTNIIEISLKTLTIMIAIVQISAIWVQKYLLYLDMNSLNYVGVMIALIAVIIFIISVISMGNSWRAGIDQMADTKLVTDKIYKISRNPAFLSFDLFYIGLSLALNNWLLIILSVTAIIIFHFQILEEEKYLQNKFGNEYNEYKKNVARYLIIGQRQYKHIIRLIVLILLCGLVMIPSNVNRCKIMILNNHFNGEFKMASDIDESYKIGYFVQEGWFGAFGIESYDGLTTYTESGYPDSINKYRITRFSTKNSKYQIFGVGVGFNVKDFDKQLTKFGYQPTKLQAYENGKITIRYEYDKITEIISSFTIILHTTNRWGIQY